MGAREIVYKGVSKIIGLTVDNEILKKIDRETTEKGPPAGLKIIFSDKNSPDILWEGDEIYTKKVLSDPQKAILAVSNHPKFIEPLVFLSSFPPRKNITIIARNGSGFFFGKEIEKHIIPVYHKPFLENSKNKKERQTKNLIQIDKAIKKIKENEVIFIAPDGGNDRGSNKWKRGSALLMEAALEMDEAYLVMGHVQQSKPFEQIHVFLKKDLKRQVKISEAIPVKNLPIPQQIKELPHNDKEKLMQISKIMENYYKTWADITDFQQKSSQSIKAA